MGTGQRTLSSVASHLARLCACGRWVEFKGGRRRGGGSHYHQENFIPQQPLLLLAGSGAVPRGEKEAAERGSMVAESSNPFFSFVLSPAQPTFPRSLRALFRSTLCSQSPRHSPGEGSGLVRLRSSSACWELKFRRPIQSLFRCPRTDYKPLNALRIGAREGRGQREGGREEGGERRRREQAAGGAGGGGPVRECGRQG